MRSWRAFALALCVPFACAADSAAEEDAACVLQTRSLLRSQVEVDGGAEVGAFADSMAEAGVVSLAEGHSSSEEEVVGIFARSIKWLLGGGAEVALFVSVAALAAYFSVRSFEKQVPREDHEQHDESVQEGADANVATTRPRILQVAALLFLAVDAIDDSIVIPGSYDLASTLGVSAGLSGALYGTCMLGKIVGFLYARRAAQNWDQVSIRSQIIAVLCAVGCLDLVYASLLRSEALSGEKMFLILGVIRFCTGVGTGVAVLLHWMALHVTKPEDQTSFSLSYAVATNFGRICAPALLVAAVTVASRINPTGVSVRSQCAVPFYPLATLWFALAALVSFVTPPRLDLELVDEKADQSSAPPVATLSVELRQTLVRLGWAIALERSFVVVGIELGTTMLLEVQFGWPIRSVGIGLMIVGFVTIVVCCLGAAAKSVGRGPGARMLVASSVVGVFAMLPLFDFKQFGPSAILTADAVIYAAFFLTQGICDGISVNAAVKEKTGYTLEDYQLGKVLCLCLARAGGATCARLALDHFGRNAYAGLQLATGLLGCATACRMASLV